MLLTLNESKGFFSTSNPETNIKKKDIEGTDGRDGPIEDDREILTRDSSGEGPLERTWETRQIDRDTRNTNRD